MTKARFEDRAPTTDQLRADIDSGRTGDKVPAGDPAASPLGTDDEAAGRPAGPKRRAQAEKHEMGRFGGSPPLERPDREGNRSVVFIIIAAVLVTGAAVASVGYYLH